MDFTNAERLEIRRLVKEEITRCSGSDSIMSTTKPKRAGTRKLTNLYSIELKTMTNGSMPKNDLHTHI